MPKSKKKFYAVRHGRKTGIFETWEACREQIISFSGASYKSFGTKEEAELYMAGVSHPLEEAEETDLPVLRAYVDGSYDIATKRYSCGVVILFNCEKLTMNDVGNDKELRDMRNVAGELMGAQKAMEYGVENAGAIGKLVIYHDYEGIAKWCTGDWAAKKPGTQAYKSFYDEVSKKIRIEFVKVAAHTGDIYNEEADDLAKKALETVA